MGKIEVICDWCKKPIQRYPCKVKKHNFCCRPCMWAYQSKLKNPDGYADLKDLSGIGKRMHAMNIAMNPYRMTPEVREKLHNARTKFDSAGYLKVYGKHEHRQIAESILHRKLSSHEIVHHIDKNKRNNDPSNLIVLTQSQHAHLHAVCQNKREVITDEFQAA